MSKEYNDRWTKPLRPGVQALIDAEDFVEKLADIVGADHGQA